MATTSSRAANTVRLVAIALRYGCRPGLARIIIAACREYGLPISLGFALFYQESGFRKVFGHDPTIFVGAGLVTKAKYLRYRNQRRDSGNRLMQGVGEGQLTWWETQDLCDRMGGCWKASANVRCAVMTLAARIRELGYAKGCERYNGTGPAAVNYSRKLRATADVWHDRFTPRR